MRRLVLVGPYPPPWGGISVHMQALHRFASSRGIDVSIVDTGEGHRLRNGSADVFQGGGASGLIAAVKRAHQQPLHVHIPGNNAKSWLSALALGRPFRLGGPGAILSVHSGLAPATLASRRSREIARAASAGYETIFCTNESISRALSESGVARAKLEVLPPFLPGASTLPPLPHRLATLRARSDPLVVAAVAEGPQYGARLLLRGVESLARTKPRLGVLIFGPGSERLVDSHWLRKRGLSERMELLGPIDHATAMAVMSLGDVFVRPTLVDGDSVSVREALGLGVRVVASDVGNRPREATLFQVGDPADLVRAIDASLSGPSPAKGAGAADSSARLLAAWGAAGLSIRGGVV